MPLSEEELRLLEQMERALVAEDPKLASTLRGTRLRQRTRRHLVIGLVGFVAGLVTLMAGVVSRMTVVGVVGFVLMLGAAYLALGSWRARDAAPAAPTTGESAGGDLRVIRGGKSGGRGSRKPSQQGSMMDRFEERWRRRRDQNGL